MRFAIVKNSGSNPPPQLSYDFSPPGGTIGRGTENNWYLPDDDLTIARLQIIVSISVDGECRISNQGSTSEVLLNMIPLAPNRQIEVRDGDMLNIGDYQIQIMDTDKGSSQQATIPLAAGEATISSEIWDDIEQLFTTPDAAPPLDPHQIQPALDGNDPLDSDFLRNNPLIKDQHTQERNPIDPLAQIETTTDLDALQLRATDPIAMFDSDTTFQQEDILNDHTPTTLLPLDDQGEDKQEIDPLALFANKHLSDKHLKTTQYANNYYAKNQYAKNNDPLSQMLNNAVPLNPVDDAVIPQPQSIFPEPAEPFELFEPSPERARADTPKIEPIEEEIFHDPLKYAQEPQQNDARHQGTDKYQAGRVKLEGKLLTALLDGMGLKETNTLQFDEQQMYQLGLLASRLTQCIITLNASRIQLKRQANADMTQSLLDANNPFKLLPSGQSVLALMFGGHIPGFMPLEQATHDILIELQAHQLGMIAGIRAITTDILHLFHPAVLERKARADDCLPRLSLSSTNKASMWEYLTKQYQKAVHEFEQDSVLFGANFLQAYEAEVNRYKDSQS
ncbi:type VI secretion system-associated FHA domain protein [Xenorhabdus sp. IM139775]|uniref:type VI secretion system-associated FHA domain protein n=1 Tax=Xenorhabdus sp. IM139775 TaxID=3025876 RepID=UPI002358B9F5|nr:type VI secretion system-associated FHA domain protein [Xenorhabdus sp. IM139775]MDC9593280.1 FHA domain-containing protein [Xenorhabdus sp. IM139775]